MIVKFQTRFEVLRRTSKKEMTVKLLVSLQDTFPGFFETEYQSQVCNDLFDEGDDWLSTDNFAMHGTPSNTAQEACINSRISQTSHASYLGPNCNHQAPHAAFSTATVSDPTRKQSCS